MHIKWWLKIIIPIMLMLFGCSSDKGEDENLSTIQYEVSSGAYNTTIIYRDENGVDQEITNIDSHTRPWTYVLSAVAGTHLELSARLLGDNPDTVIVTIKVNHLDTNEQRSYGVGVSARITYDIPLTD
jgi:hypothetical protein